MNLLMLYHYKKTTVVLYGPYEEYVSNSFFTLPETQYFIKPEIRYECGDDIFAGRKHSDSIQIDGFDFRVNFYSKNPNDWLVYHMVDSLSNLPPHIRRLALKTLLI